MKRTSEELKSLLTKSELALVLASQPPALDKWTALELKRYAVQARKLFDKWQGLARDQSRDQRKKSGASDLQSRTHQKQEIFQNALQALEAALQNAERTAPGSSGATKPTSELRTRQARVVRQSTRKELHRTKQAINKTAAKPTAATPSAVKKVKTSKTTKAATKATKSPSKPASARATTKKGVAAKATKPAVTKIATQKIAPKSAASQRAIQGKAKARKLDASGKTTRVAGHVSAKGKRAQARRDSKR